MLIQQKPQQSVAARSSRVARQTHKTTMDDNRGILPGDEESTPKPHVTTPGQQEGRLPVESGMPLGSSPSSLEPRRITSFQVLDNTPWDVGPSFAYFPIHYRASHLSGQGVPSQSLKMREWWQEPCCQGGRTLSSTSGKDKPRPSDYSPNYPEKTAYMSSRDLLWSETSTPVSYGAYFIFGQSDNDDMFGPHDLTPQGLQGECQTWPGPSSPTHIRDTVESPPLSRASTATVSPESERGHPERRQSRSSASPGESRTPSPAGRWACRECDKQFQDKTALKYAPSPTTTSMTRLTRTANIYVITPIPSSARHAPASFRSPRI